ncbi:Transcriptional regulator PadR-like family protein [Deinococcus reticulitermitis]|uniref:Transcriptional regulator PadR-like family protein n=1 Tax=Deinococcus reticulitermitis TaxID=856736 RepID=A0A1H7B7M1_9DEIO|nr:PadR family transcriptional regulator [Deinococcus reticulitermitis]SEJ70280.1 Transcriptional regulator PadR-like family protein [Deinococcus reticulitermitis]
MPPRMTPQTIAVLLALAQDFDHDHYGFDLLRQTGLQSGTVYPALIRLETHGLVRHFWEEIDPTQAGRPRRRLYRLTASGIELARQLQGRQTGQGVGALA